MPDVEREPLLPFDAIEHMALAAGAMAAAEEFGIEADLVPTVFFEEADQSVAFELAAEFLAENPRFTVETTSCSYNAGTGMFRLILPSAGTDRVTPPGSTATRCTT